MAARYEDWEKDKMNIETSRMIIRNFTPEDAADLHEIFGDDETMENCEPAYDFEKTKEFLTSFCIGRKGAVAAVHKESNKVIGYILFNDADEGVYEMGWIYNRRFWRQGYAYESCKAVIDYAFGELKAHKVFAEAIDTVKSVSLMRTSHLTSFFCSARFIISKMMRTNRNVSAKQSVYAKTAVRSSSPLFPTTLFSSQNSDMTLNISATVIMTRKPLS